MSGNRENQENIENKQEKLTPGGAVEKLDAILENDEIKTKLDQLANKRGWSLDILKNCIVVFVEDYPNNQKLSLLLEKLAEPSNENEKVAEDGGENDKEDPQETMEELLDLVA